MNVSKLIRTESYSKGMLLSVLFNGISKGILFLLTIIIARYFGSDIKTDIYFYVFATMILFSGFINNIDTAVLIPESMRLRQQEGNETANAFLNYFLAIYFFIGILFTVGMYFWGGSLFGLLSKFSEADINTYHEYFWLGSFFFIFHVLTNYLNSILTSLKYFSLPMIISSIKSCIVIVCIFLLKARYDVLSVILGGLISYAINLLIQLYVLYAIAGWKFRFKNHAIRRPTWGNVIYSQLGQITTVASSMLPLYLLSGFGSGVISLMNYGKNVADIPNTLITAQLANVSGIKLNEEMARRDMAGMNATFLHASKLLILILVPLGFFMFVFAEPLTALFYQRGNFTSEEVIGAARFMQLLSVTIFSIGINAMVTRVFIATQAIKQAFVYQIVLNVLLIAAIWLFTNIYGQYGYPYAIIMVNCINFIGMYLICKKYFKVIEYGKLLAYSAKMIVVNLLPAIVLYYLLPMAGFDSLYNLLIGAAIYLLVFVFMLKTSGINQDETLNEKA